jgi:hypothetical protein
MRGQYVITVAALIALSITLALLYCNRNAAKYSGQMGF